MDLLIGLVALYLFFCCSSSSLFVSVYVHASLCDFVCIGLLLPFVLGFCLFMFWVWFFWCFFFSLPFLLSRVAGRVLVLWPGVGPEPSRWEGRVQDIGPPETSWPHVIPIGGSSTRDLRLNTNAQLHPTASKLQCWKPHAKQLARQEHNPTH